VELALGLPVAAGPGGQGGQGGRVGHPVAGDQVGDLDGLLSLLRDRAAQLRDLGGAGEPGPGRRQRDLDRPAGPAGPAAAAVLTAETAGMRAQGSLGPHLGAPRAHPP
jgi:hypothetical protein